MMCRKDRLCSSKTSIACRQRRHDRDPKRSRAGTPPDKTEEKSVADKFGVTISGLLNVLDGFHAPDDVLFMMTTNKVEALDPALLRPGRIDYRLYLGVASEQQKLELYRRFFPLRTSSRRWLSSSPIRGRNDGRFPGSFAGTCGGRNLRHSEASAAQTSLDPRRSTGGCIALTTQSPFGVRIRSRWCFESDPPVTGWKRSDELANGLDELVVISPSWLSRRASNSRLASTRRAD